MISRWSVPDLDLLKFLVPEPLSILAFLFLISLLLLSRFQCYTLHFPCFRRQKSHFVLGSCFQLRNLFLSQFQSGTSMLARSHIRDRCILMGASETFFWKIWSISGMTLLGSHVPKQIAKMALQRWLCVPSLCDGMAPFQIEIIGRQSISDTWFSV